MKCSLYLNLSDGKPINTLKVHGDDDTDSVSDSSSRSQESSPTASPYQGHRSTVLAGSHSLGKLGEGVKEKFDSRKLFAICDYWMHTQSCMHTHTCTEIDKCNNKYIVTQ